MIAIGFVLVVSMLLLIAALGDEAKSWVKLIGGSLLLIGLALIIAGCAVWLWRVAP